MRHLAPIAAALAVAVALGGCAPAALGSSASNPFPAAGGTPTLRGGETIYVRLDHALDDLDLEPPDLQPALWVPSGYDSEVGDLSGQFALDVERVPDGWSFGLRLVRAERSSERGSGMSAAPRTVYALWSVYEITAPEGAIPGPYRFRGTLRAREGGEVPVRLDVEIVR